MNKTQYKNNFGKFFTHIIQSKIISISTNKIDTIQIEYKKNQKKDLLEIQSHIQLGDEGRLNFSFELQKVKDTKVLEPIFKDVHTIEEICLYEAQDAFCKEQALEFHYNEGKCFYILIYTNMVESSLEFFEGTVTAEKFTKVAF